MLACNTDTYTCTHEHTHVRTHACNTETYPCTHACMHTAHDARHAFNLYVHAPFVKDMDCYGY